MVPLPAEHKGNSPAFIANVGTQSGPIGSTFLPAVLALQAWVKYINAKGGLNGHPVNLRIYDDGGDPARHRAQVQDAIERENVIAFVQNNEAFTGESSVEYITSKRVPVIGSDTGSPWFYASPMYFPQQSSGLLITQLAALGVGQQTVPAGKTKLGTLFCVEARTCDAQEAEFAKAAPRAGFEHVYRGRTSLAQPDFTAECLSARNAGAQVFFIGLDPNSISRVAAACARQGFRPTFASASVLVEDRFKDDPNMAGMVAASGVFPYFQAGTPATDDYQRAMKAYGGSVPVGVGGATGWVSAKLFETAASSLPEPPTPEAVLRGLWGLDGADLGGLTSPLTFREGQPAAKVLCWFNFAIKDKSWVSPDAYTRHCAEPGP